MQEVLGTPVIVEEFAVKLLGFLTYHFGLVHLHEEQELENNQDGSGKRGRGPVIDAWRKLSDTLGRDVEYGYDVVHRPLDRAKVEDIDRTGGLVLRLADGQTVIEHSGEIVYLPGMDGA